MRFVRTPLIQRSVDTGADADIITMGTVGTKVVKVVPMQL